MKRSAVVIAFICICFAGMCAAETTVTFQQGVSPTASYAGTVDTYIHSVNKDTNNSATNPLQIKLVGTAQERVALVRFTGIFDSEATPGPIPAGTTINSATLTVRGGGGAGGSASVHRVLRSWVDTDTWNTLNAGLDDAGVEYQVAADGNNGGSIADSVAVSYDVTATVQAWSGDSATNFGWVWRGTTAGTSWYMRASEDGTPGYRPKLEIKYGPKSTEITAFTATPFITDGAVNITLTATPGDGVTIAGYAVSQSDDPDDVTEWAAEVTEYTVAPGTDEGPVVLYGYAKDSGGNIASATTRVIYVSVPVVPRPWILTASRPWWIDLQKMIDGDSNTYGLVAAAATWTTGSVLTLAHGTT